MSSHITTGEGVTTFVTRLGRKRKKRTGRNRINGTLQALDIAINCGETVAIARSLSSQGNSFNLKEKTLYQRWM